MQATIQSSPDPDNPPIPGIRVVDFSHFVAGPFCTLMLADYGADVIKVEKPEGDDFRHYPPTSDALDGQGSPFLWVNRNKRSIAIDLKTEEGRKIARQLVDKADVVVENFSSGVMARFGLDYQSCTESNPRLIYCSISGYGRTGAFADKPALDPIAQAESGFMSMNGYADREGVRTGPSTIDISTGIMASSAVLAALLARSQTGKGQFIEVAMFDTAISMLGFSSMQYLFSGAVPGRYGNTSPDTSPTGVFAASDGSFYINCANDNIFRRLCTKVLNMAELADDDRFRFRAGRLQNRDVLFSILGEVFTRDTVAAWRSKMREASIPCGHVRTVPEALDSAEVADRNLVSSIPHPTARTVPNIALPMRLAHTPVRTPIAAPVIGQHSVEILRDVLTYDTMQIATAIKDGTIRQNRVTGTMHSAK